MNVKIRIPHHARANLVCQVALATFFLAYSIRGAYHVVDNLIAGDIWANDFFAIWSFAQFAVSKPMFEMYNDNVLHDFQTDLGMRPTYHLPFAHPPSFIFFVIPLGFMSYYGAYAVWSIVWFFFYLVASCHKQMRLTTAFLAGVAPATTITLIFGQTGFLSAALIIGGFRLVSKRPVVSGVLFGLASIKPHLGILIPIALISARLWRTFAAASGTVLLLVFASSTVFGWPIWSL